MHYLDAFIVYTHTHACTQHINVLPLSTGPGQPGAASRRRDEGESFYDAAKAASAARAAATAAALAELDPLTRAAMAGQPPGTYVRLRLTGECVHTVFVAGLVVDCVKPCTCSLETLETRLHPFSTCNALVFSALEFTLNLL